LAAAIVSLPDALPICAPCRARQAARLTALVVFPPPPFWFAIVIIRQERGRGHSRPSAPPRGARAASAGVIADLPCPAAAAAAAPPVPATTVAVPCPAAPRPSSGPAARRPSPGAPATRPSADPATGGPAADRRAAAFRGSPSESPSGLAPRASSPDIRFSVSREPAADSARLTRAGESSLAG